MVSTSTDYSDCLTDLSQAYFRCLYSGDDSGSPIHGSILHHELLLPRPQQILSPDTSRSFNTFVRNQVVTTSPVHGPGDETASVGLTFPISPMFTGKPKHLASVRQVFSHYTIGGINEWSKLRVPEICKKCKVSRRK